MTTDILVQARAALDGVKHHGPWVAEGQEIWQIEDGSRFYLGDTWTEGQARFIAWAREGVPALMAEVERLLAHAGPGPYEPSEVDGSVAPTWQELRDLADHNFRLYGDAAHENRKLRAQIAAVQALHHSDEWVECVECSTHGVVGVPWPCPTILALDGEVTT